VRVGHGLLPAHPMLGKEHEQFRLRQPVSKAAIAPEHEAWQRHYQYSLDQSLKVFERGPS
jgi:hypothetical protein